MDRTRQRVGVLMGGLSAEHPISMKSGRAVAGALRQRGIDVVEVVVDRDLPARLVAEGVEVAWIALHGKFGEDGCVQGLLEVMGIPYTGSGVRASALAMDKIATKRAVKDCPSVVMAGDRVLRRGDAWPQDLVLPVVVKPPATGSTIGMRLVRAAEEGPPALVEAFSYGEEVLLEEYVAGDEITVAVIDGEALPLVRIIPDSGFFDFEAKYTKGKTVYECPAVVPAGVTRHAQRAAVEAYAAVGCSGLVRADFIVRADGVPVFLELNTIPGMTETSLSPMAAGAEGTSFADLVVRILRGAHAEAAEAHN